MNKEYINSKELKRFLREIKGNKEIIIKCLNGTDEDEKRGIYSLDIKGKKIIIEAVILE